MIVIKLELWPRGNRARARELGVMALANEGPTGGPEGACSYSAVILKSASHGAKSPGVWRSCLVQGYPRDSRSVGVMDLLRSALNGCLAGRPTWSTTALPSRMASLLARAATSDELRPTDPRLDIISRTILALLHAWTRAPERRLGELVVSAATAAECPSVHLASDEELLAALEAMAAEAAG